MDISGIDCLGIDRVLKRGSGEIIADTDHALLARDSVSGAHFLACDDSAEGLAVLERHMVRNWDLLMVTDHALGRLVFDRYGFSDKLECRQVAYYGEKPTAFGGLTVRQADERDLTMLMENYSLISREEMEAVVRRRLILLGYDQGQLIGFIGEHLEGSMGMLYVFPLFRRKGYGAALEKQLIAKTMDKGLIPFGQVEKTNRKSLNLQKKIGMTQSDHLMVWMWR